MWMNGLTLIHRISILDNKVTFQAGGAIVADSTPSAEYQETLVKARGLIRALTKEGEKIV